MKNGFFIIDGDGHVHEDVDGGEALRRHMDPQFRTRPFRGGGFVDRSEALVPVVVPPIDSTPERISWALAPAPHRAA